MKRSDIKKLPEYFDRYINLVDDIELSEAFDKSLRQIDDLDIEKLNRIGLRTYEDGKWSINKIIQHITDWERIFCYRTILFARSEGSIPEGHEENVMAANSNADELPIEQLVAELRAVRVATKAMFDSFNRQILETNCKFYNYEMSVLAMGFNTIGHQLHHFKVIEERYFPLDK
ncbi:DinB family protein [Biomphalaria pfeifferi]|uniref:DinB family protein n=1 Tax=Biomphalaria pfeifferi TaxID=112525 RepID=A0AAD8AML4_BIOPF|nr:DinB family protein [Biomphalaria pfeifferi]